MVWRPPPTFRVAFGKFDCSCPGYSLWRGLGNLCQSGGLRPGAILHQTLHRVHLRHPLGADWFLWNRRARGHGQPDRGRAAQLPYRWLSSGFDDRPNYFHPRRGLTQ